MQRAYQIVGRTQQQRITQHLVVDSLLLLRFVDIVEHCRLALDDLIGVMGIPGASLKAKVKTESPWAPEMSDFGGHPSRGTLAGVRIPLGFAFLG